MFRAISCSSSGGQIVLIQHLVSSLSVSDRPVHRLREDSAKHKKKYWKLNVEALDLTLWRNGFGKVYGPVVRRTTE